MREFKSIKFYSVFAGFLSLMVIFSSSYAQEYDDMYFNKSDRKTVKVENKAIKSLDNTDYNQATKSTEVYSAKNVNPEYIARYKSTESNESQGQVVNNSEYNSDDYFIENYNTPDSAIGAHQNQIDYAALNKRDQMSYSKYNNSYSNPYGYRGFSPYMSMGYGMPFGYDPFMMGYGYGPGMSMGIGSGFGSGFYPSMSYSIAMSWGTGYNPWGGWGAYPYHNPYSMRGFYDPWGWGPSYAYRGYSPYYGGAYGMGGYGYSRPYYTVSTINYYENGSGIAYKPRTTSRSATTTRISQRNADNIRVSSADSKIRVPSRTTSAASNGRISRDYSKTQNEYYSRARTNSSSQRLSTSGSSRNSYARTSGSSNYSSISNNRPSRISNSSSGYNRSGSSSYSGYSNGSRSSSSYSTPSRTSSGSSSFNRSSYSSGSSGASYSGSRSSSGTSSGSRSSSSSGGSRSGGRQ